MGRYVFFAFIFSMFMMVYSEFHYEGGVMELENDVKIFSIQALIYPYMAYNYLFNSDEKARKDKQKYLEDFLETNILPYKYIIILVRIAYSDYKKENGGPAVFKFKFTYFRHLMYFEEQWKNGDRDKMRKIANGDIVIHRVPNLKPYEFKPTQKNNIINKNSKFIDLTKILSGMRHIQFKNPNREYMLNSEVVDTNFMVAVKNLKGVVERIYITETNMGVHARGDKSHYTGHKMDIRSTNLSYEEIVKVMSIFKKSNKCVVYEYSKNEDSLEIKKHLIKDGYFTRFASSAEHIDINLAKNSNCK